MNLNCHQSLDTSLKALYSRGLVDHISQDQPAILSLDHLYRKMISKIESQLWKPAFNPELLGHYQKLHREYQAFRLENGLSEDDRRFVIVITVADRPHHVKQCLGSLLELCRCYEYGGFHNGRYQKVEVILADDSRDEINIKQHRSLVDEFNRYGLKINYFGQQQQREVIASIDDRYDDVMQRIIGDTDPERFYHKGASAMRNIVYLKLKQLDLPEDKYLIYMIDSDQEFNAGFLTPSSKVKYSAINYLYELNRVFCENDITVVTGKVVGDPPVSPSVMTSRLLDDVRGFLSSLQQYDHDASCQYHDIPGQVDDDASYHDMADLFGFARKQIAFDYACDLDGEHSIADCAVHFSQRLQSFFHGAHPTRKTWYSYSTASESMAPARTIYTGNYIIKPSAADYFIPFADQKLRMAGPTLGRLIRASLGARFVSINLPMNHERTITNTGLSEFRPGVNQQDQLFDFSSEFERQYFGDVMLFSVERLSQEGYPESLPGSESLMRVLMDIDRQMYERYSNRQQEILGKLDELESFLNADSAWWNTDGCSVFSENVRQFLNCIRYNFSSDANGWAIIENQSLRRDRLHKMHEALGHYYSDHLVWKTMEMISG